MIENKKKIVVGISGGVDSSVAGYLLKKEGHEVIGVTMQTWDSNPTDLSGRLHKEAGEQMLIDAKKVTDALDIPWYVIDFHEEFDKWVKDYFVEEYLAGRTPNPCVVCNRKVKWEALLERAKDFGAEYVATGHYARIDQLENGRYAIQNSVTAKKDQTYVLYRLTQDQLAYTIMPIGAFEKEEIREIAREAGIPVAEKKDSEENCFIPDNDYAGYITRKIGHEPEVGNFVKPDGTIIGPHKGIIHYTVGQRKGLNLAMGHPVFVTEIRKDTNEVVIGEAEDVFSKEVWCDQINFMAVEDLPEPEQFIGKIRYAHGGAPCIAQRVGDKLKVVFDEPQRAVTPGQSLVLYRDGYVAGGGVITSAGK